MPRIPCRSGASRDRADKTAAPPASRRRDSKPGRSFSAAKAINHGSNRRARPLHTARRQDNNSLNLRAEPQGQGSLRPSFSTSSLSPWTSRRPRLTRDSDGKPLRRLRVISRVGATSSAMSTMPQSSSWSAASKSVSKAGRGVKRRRGLALQRLESRRGGWSCVSCCTSGCAALAGVGSRAPRSRRLRGSKAARHPSGRRVAAARLSRPDASSPTPRPGPCRPCRPAWP